MEQCFRKARIASMPLRKSWATSMRHFASQRDVLPGTGLREQEKCLVPLLPESA